jgi:2-methylaconitate cis-trans-isomerase PrpF
MEADEPAVYGEYSVDGVPGTGAKIESTFKQPGGGVTGSLFPTGNTTDTIDTGAEELDVSVVDATNVVVFLRAADLGLTGTELPDELGARQEILDLLARVRETIQKNRP